MPHVCPVLADVGLFFLLSPVAEVDISCAQKHVGTDALVRALNFQTNGKYKMLTANC